jgi:phosphoserine phosphatase RsbU/P
LVTILSLRRHEKDYIIRNEQKYILKLNDLATNYIKELEVNQRIPKLNRDSLTRNIEAYQKCFNQLVGYDHILGIKSFSGLRKEIEEQQNQILADFLKLKEGINSESSFRQRAYVLIYLVLSGLILLISVLLSFFISRILTRRITKLSLYINEYVNSNFKINGKLQVKNINDEIGVLINNFEILKENLSKHINNLEAIVQERTIQLKKQNNDIIASINYAKKIQEALLPDRAYLEKYFPENLIYYKPHSIVSGDFYWFKRFEDKNISVMAVADCTGHGVPGAMMSMLGIAFLNEIVVRETVTSASEILDALRIQIIEHLNNSQKNLITDGMDMSILVFFHNKKTVQFAGAKRDLLFFRNSELTIYKGDKQTIGKSYSRYSDFTNYEFTLEDNDVFYLLTDGFQDQLGALSKRTLQRRYAYDFFKEVNQINFKLQSKIIEDYLSYWKKDEPQTDDILIVGLKYSEKTIQGFSERRYANNFN